MRINNIVSKYAEKGTVIGLFDKYPHEITVFSYEVLAGDALLAVVAGLVEGHEKALKDRGLPSTEEKMKAIHDQFKTDIDKYFDFLTHPK